MKIKFKLKRKALSINNKQSQEKATSRRPSYCNINHNTKKQSSRKSNNTNGVENMLKKRSSIYNDHVV